MDGFSYYNIFETKGFEYLATILFFAILIPFWIILNKRVQIKKQIEKVIGILTANILKVPHGIFHSKNHTWTYLEKSGTAKVGLDDLLLHITGEVKISGLKNSGEKVSKGDLLTEIEQNSKKLKVFAPISGEIIKTNFSIEDAPEIINSDPYGKGWIYKIKPSNWVAETNSYYLAEDTTDWVQKELERFKEFLVVSMHKLSPQTPMALQDGGELRDNSLSELPTEVWNDFQNEFLSVST